MQVGEKNSRKIAVRLEVHVPPGDRIKTKQNKEAGSCTQGK
jgi:hypothetical protein